MKTMAERRLMEDMMVLEEERLEGWDSLLWYGVVYDMVWHIVLWYTCLVWNGLSQVWFGMVCWDIV